LARAAIPEDLFPFFKSSTKVKFSHPFYFADRGIPD
jgi:hypothetical protein